MDDSRCQGQAEESNRALWGEMARVPIAYKEVDLVRRGEEILDPVELREIGQVSEKTMLHLQCHIGADSLAWVRRGAVMTGIDLSGQAIACAEGLRAILDEEFDVVYTSRGILCWLRDLEESALWPTSSTSARSLAFTTLAREERVGGTPAWRACPRPPLFPRNGADGVHMGRDGRETLPDEDGA